MCTICPSPNLLKLPEERCQYQIGSSADISSLSLAKLRTERWDGTLIAEQRVIDPVLLADLETMLRSARPTGGSKSPSSPASRAFWSTSSPPIKNQGNAAAGAFVVKFTPEGMSSQTQTITGLPAGSSQTLTWTFVAPTLTTTASRSLSVLADSTGVIAESYEVNNTGAGSVTIIGEKPDLTVTALTADADSYKPGERVTITATVKNNGTVACPAGKLRLASDGITTQAKNIATLVAGGTQTVSFTFTAPQVIGEMTYAITATADPDNQIAESDEGNNNRGGSFKVSNPLPDLTVTQIRFDKNEYEEGENGTVTVTVRNQGARNVSDAKLKLILGDFFQPF